MKFPVTRIGTSQVPGVVCAEAQKHDFPGITLFGTVTDVGTRKYYAVWVSSTGVLRILDATARLGANNLFDYTGFDQDAAGVAVGSQV